MNAFQQRINGPTENGGAYAIAFYLTAQGLPASKEVAEAVELVEYDARGEQIARTYATLGSTVS